MENIKDGKVPAFQHPFVTIENVEALLEGQNYIPEKEICIATKLSLDFKKTNTFRRGSGSWQNRTCQNVG